MTDHLAPGTKPTGASKERLRTLRKTVEHYARSERDHASGETIRELIEAAAVLQSLENAPETGAYPEYTSEIGDAGDQYMKSVSLDGRYHLSGMFRWYELWDAMNKATALKANQPSNSAPSAAVSRNVAPSNEGAKPATVGADPLAQLEDDATFGAIVEEIQAQRGEKSEL